MRMAFLILKAKVFKQIYTGALLKMKSASQQHTNEL